MFTVLNKTANTDIMYNISLQLSTSEMILNTGTVSLVQKWFKQELINNNIIFSAGRSLNGALRLT